jgi:hypothetical protein
MNICVKTDVIESNDISFLCIYLSFVKGDRLILMLKGEIIWCIMEFGSIIYSKVSA